VCDGTHCQVYDAARLKSSRFAVDAARAVAATRGVILRYANRPAEALFHADCGGHTAAAETIWGGAPLPYLQSLADNVPTLEHRAWHLALTSEDLRHALNLDPLTAVGGRLTGISVATHDASGRAMTVQLDGERSPLVRAEELRAIVNRTFGAHGLQSTHFSLTRRTGTFVFDGVGYGHGVGLCQIGALTRARRGATAEQILSYYFPGTTLGR
jgi:stage II sporulation protein D